MAGGIADPRASRRLLPALALAGILAGALAWLAGAGGWADVFWGSTTVVVLVPLALAVAADLRRGKLGVDLIALVAMAGSPALGIGNLGARSALQCLSYSLPRCRIERGIGPSTGRRLRERAAL